MNNNDWLIICVSEYQALFDQWGRIKQFGQHAKVRPELAEVQFQLF